MPQISLLPKYIYNEFLRVIFIHVHVRLKHVLFEYFPEKRSCVECNLTFRSVWDTNIIEPTLLIKHHAGHLSDVTVTSSFFNITSLYSGRQTRGSWEQVLITTATAHVTLTRGINLSTKLHGITFKTTITFTFTAVKTSYITLMIFGAEYEIMNLLISAARAQENIWGLKHKYCMFSIHSYQQTHIQEAPAQRSGRTYGIS